MVQEDSIFAHFMELKNGNNKLFLRYVLTIPENNDYSFKKEKNILQNLFFYYV